MHCFLHPPNLLFRFDKLIENAKYSGVSDKLMRWIGFTATRPFSHSSLMKES